MALIFVCFAVALSSSFFLWSTYTYLPTLQLPPSQHVLETSLGVTSMRTPARNCAARHRVASQILTVSAEAHSRLDAYRPDARSRSSLHRPTKTTGADYRVAGRLSKILILTEISILRIQTSSSVNSHGRK
jgi:hypothetical protein